MKTVIRSFLFVVIWVSVSLPLTAEAGPDCVVGERCKVRVLDVRPTQALAGLKQVAFVVEEIEEVIDDEDALKELRKDRPGTAVFGPGDELYLVDGHHFARALYDAGVSKMYVEINADWSHLTTADFWARMDRKGWAYLRDQMGRSITHRQLPRSVAGLRDDPYRTLAWMVKEARGFNNLKAPFQEFHWALYFRQKGVRIASGRLTSYRKAFAEAMNWARSREASRLPGYRSGRQPNDPDHWYEVFDEIFGED